MIFLDMLMALGVILILTVGVENVSFLQIVLWLAGLGVAIVAAHWLVGWFAGKLALGWYRMDSYRPASRRYLSWRHAGRTRQEDTFDEMSETELRAHIEAHPKEHLACEILCERLIKEKRHAEYTREMEYFLSLKSDLTIEEKCSRYHQLADVYLNDLKRPDRAREALRAITATFPKHYQATLARRRLELMDQPVRTWGSPEE